MRIKNSFRDFWAELEFFFLQKIAILSRKIRGNGIDISSMDEVRLHLGCGYVEHDSFINIDISPLHHVHYIQKIDKLTRFQDASVDLIYACHCLEHFSHRELPSILNEWKRVLKSDGVLRISVPDFDKLLIVYKSTGFLDSILHPLLGSHDNKYDIHKSVFNKSLLEELFLSAGFSTVREWHPGTDYLTTFDDWSSKKIKVNGQEYSVSLNLEAVK